MSKPGVSKLFAKRVRFGKVRMCGGRPFTLKYFEPLKLNANERFYNIVFLSSTHKFYYELFIIKRFNQIHVFKEQKMKKN